MKLFKFFIIPIIVLVSSCTTIQQSEPFTSEDVANVVLAKNYSKEKGPEGVTTEFNLDGSIYAIFSFKSDKVIKGRTNHHTARVSYYKQDELVYEKEHAFDIKNSIWYAWIPTYAITFKEGDYIAKFYIDENFIDSIGFNISIDN